MAARVPTGLSGVLPVDKPAGMTSHDVVAVVRRATGEKRVGHAGTLDPAATGLLVVLVGPATRLEPYLSSASKSYRATISFGTSTDTDDAQGAVAFREPVPAELFDRSFAEELLRGFLGVSQQMPPEYSAIKLGGVTAHKAARAGTPLELSPRGIEVFEARLEGLDEQELTWDVSFVVSKGTYIRSLARDIGVAGGTRAHLSALRRTASGSLDLSHAAELDAVVLAGVAGVSELFVDPLLALGDLPIVEAEYDDVSNGRPLQLPDSSARGTGQLFAVVCGERLHALYRAQADKLVPETVLATGIRRRS